MEKPTIIFALVLVLTLTQCQWMQSDEAPPSSDIAVRAGNIGGLGCGLVLGLGCGLVVGVRCGLVVGLEFGLVVRVGCVVPRRWTIPTHTPPPPPPPYLAHRYYAIVPSPHP